MFRLVLRSRKLRNGLVYFKQEISASTVASVEHNKDVLPFSKIPKIRTFPYIGSGWIYYPLIGKYDIHKLHLASIQKYQEYGPIYLEALSEDNQMVSIYHPEDIAKAYRSEGAFPNRRTVDTIGKYRRDKKHLYSNGGLLTTKGEEWWSVRKQVQPHMLKPKSVHAYVGAMDEVARAFTNRMVHLRSKDGEIQNYLQELYKWALESVSLVAFDARLGCVDFNPNQESLNIISAVNNVFEEMMKMEFGSLNLWKRFPTKTYRKFEKNMDYISREAFKYLQEARKRLETKTEDQETTFLEQMISTTRDPRDVNAMVTDMIFAGVDTTSSAVAFTLYHLARNPDVQEKLHEEIKSVVKGKSLCKEVLDSVHYLKACVKESMRLNPVATANLRTLAEDTVLSGYCVPAGTQVLFNLYALGHMEKYFPKAETFMPERFLREGVVHDPFAYLPFGFGKRSCIGRRIAEQEIWTLLIRLIERFRVEYNYEDIGMHVRLVGIPDKPLRFQFNDRRS